MSLFKEVQKLNDASLNFEKGENRHRELYKIRKWNLEKSFNVVFCIRHPSILSIKKEKKKRILDFIKFISYTFSHSLDLFWIVIKLYFRYYFYELNAAILSQSISVLTLYRISNLLAKVTDKIKFDVFTTLLT